MPVTGFDVGVVLVAVGGDFGDIHAVVGHAADEDIVVEEPVHVDAGGFGEGVAQLFGRRGSIGIGLQIIADAGEEVLAAHVIHHGVDDDGATVVDGVAVIRHVERHVVQRNPVAFAFAPVGYLVDEGAHVFLEVVLAIHAHAVKQAAELGESFVEPHVASGGAGDHVAEVHVRQLVCHIFLLGGVAGDDPWGDGDVVDMFHASLACAYVADAVKRVGAEVLFIECGDVLHVDEGSWDAVDLCRLHVDLHGDVAFDAVIDIFPDHVVADGEGGEVGGDVLRDFRVPVAGAVAVVNGLDKLAATNGLLVIGRGDIDIV